jgi:hypothetical protein
LAIRGLAKIQIIILLHFVQSRERIKPDQFTRNPILTHARLRDNNFPSSSSSSSMSSFANSESPSNISSLASSPLTTHSLYGNPNLRQDLSSRNYYASQLHQKFSPMDFTITRRRHDSIVTSGGSNPPSPFLSARNIAQAVIVECLEEASEEVQSFLLEVRRRRKL